MVDLVHSPERGVPAALHKGIFTRKEVKALLILGGLLLAWFLFARFLVYLYPDGQSGSASAFTNYAKYAARNGGFFLFFCGLIGLWKVTKDSGDKPLAQHLSEKWQSADMSPLALPIKLIIALSSFALFIFTYSTVKTRIPEIEPYGWDEFFWRLDRILFFGNDPWTLFAWLYEFPLIIRVMDFIYDIWAVIMVGVWAMCFMHKSVPAEKRFQFPLALMLTWLIGGNLLAITFSSAGPCYFGAITGLTDPYAAQMSALTVLDEQSTLRAVRYQDILWQVYESPSLGLGGISAMPSMHCATSFLLILLAWGKKPLRYAAMIFFAFIFIASFVLAWHYAVDGLLAVPVALISWFSAGYVLKRVMKDKSAV